MRRKGQSPQRTLLSGVLLTTLIVAVAWVIHLVVLYLETSRRAHLTSLLVAAVEKADAPQVADLLRQGADPNAKVPDERFASPPPSWKEQFYHLLSPPCCEGIQYGFQTPALLCSGKIDIVQSLLAAGADVNVTDEGGQTALCHAVGDPALMNLLISKGADVNQGNPLAIAVGVSGWWNSPAICAKALQSAQILLAHGATLQGQAGQEALTSAAGAGNLGMVKLLLSKGVKANADTLSAAAGAGSVQIVKVVLDKGVPVNARTSDGKTALFACDGMIWKGHPQEVARLLLQRGANVHTRALDGSTALFYADRSVAQILLDHNANVNARRNDGNTVLTMTTIRGDGNMIKWLLRHGADFHIHNKGGHTALMLAIAYDRREAETYLRRAGEHQ